jgi:homoserine kinase
MRLRYKRVHVRVPATTSNLGPGFDVLGLALNLHNEVELEILPTPGLDVVEIEGEGKATLPRDGDNMILRAVRSQLTRRICPSALNLRLTNRIPLARGLGSSAAARLGGILAAYALCGERSGPALTCALDAACQLEGHPDNVVPALHGGLCAAIQNKDQIDFVQFNVPKSLGTVVCVPEFELSTEKARKVLPSSISRQDAIWTSGRVAFLLRAIEHGEFQWLKLAMEDVLHQPYRQKLVPGLNRVIDAAVRHGAFGAALSGAGPTVFAFAPKGPRGSRIGKAMEKAFRSARIKSRSWALDIDRRGAQLAIIC